MPAEMTEAEVGQLQMLHGFSEEDLVITSYSIHYTKLYEEVMTARWMFLVSSMVLFLFAGLFLEGIAAMLVLVPILHPIAISMGVDPTHFGILVVFNLMIGLITPPMSLCLFVADAVANVVV